jgi:sialate O-acetylesterase
MFNGMIAPLRPLTPSGVLWYQGESNVDKGDYAALLPGLIRDWRAWFGRELPFVVVQLPNYGAITSTPAESQWAALRNIQQRVALHDERVALAVTQDLGDDADIHPRRKYAVAERALQAARAIRGAGAPDGVVPSVTATPDSLAIGFSPPLSMDTEGKAITGFELCGSQPGSCVSAPAVQRGGRIDVDDSLLPSASRVRYCWSDGGTCELRSFGGLPVGSFELPVKRAPH